MSDKPQKQTDKLSKEKVAQYQKVKHLQGRVESCEFFIQNPVGPIASAIAASFSQTNPNSIRDAVILTKREFRSQQEHLADKKKEIEKKIEEYIKENNLPSLQEILSVSGF